MKNLFPILLLSILGCKQQDNGKPLVVASADKMNVLYIGVENPVSIAVSGYSPDKIKAIMDEKQGTIKGENGKYSVMVKGGGAITINIFSKEDDKEVFLDSINFRVKRIPNPTASLKGITGSGKIKKEDLLKAEKIDEYKDIVFNTNTRVVYFVMTAMIGGQIISIEEDSDRINESMKKMINNLKAGQKIYIDEVKVRTPDGTRRSIEGITLTIQ